MAKKRAGSTSGRSVTGAAMLQGVFPLLARLSRSGTQRNQARNRRLLFSQYASLMLIGLFNPVLLASAKVRDAVRRLFRRALANQSCPSRETPSCRLRQSTRDDDRRSGRRQIRDWPRKKREQPPGPPQLRVTTRQERQQEQRVRDRISPSWRRALGAIRAKPGNNNWTARGSVASPRGDD